MVQNEEKADTPSSEATKILSVYSEAMAPPIPNNRKIHQHLVPNIFGFYYYGVEDAYDKESTDTDYKSWQVIFV